eukprot:3104486-Rhodomonas_salina.1
MNIELPVVFHQFQDTWFHIPNLCSITVQQTNHFRSRNLQSLVLLFNIKVYPDCFAILLVDTHISTQKQLFLRMHSHTTTTSIYQKHRNACKGKAKRKKHCNACKGKAKRKKHSNACKGKG